jgi:4-hydroxybenzoate polyprenyltransferase
MNYFNLLRVTHWVKNLIIFIPIILCKDFSSNWVTGILAFLSFSFLASAGYIFNDIQDLESDRSHPIKKNRAIASGKVSKSIAIVIMIFLLFLSLIISNFINSNLLYYSFAYIILHFLYTNYFKRISYIDILFLNSFYLVRLFFGAVSTNTFLTGWLVVFVFFAMLTLSIEKRFAELMLVNGDLRHRGYSKSDIQQLNIIKYVSVFVALLVLNIHAYIILNITFALFYGFLNILGMAIVFLFFKEDRSDDIVKKVYANIPLMISSLLLLILYLVVI